MATIDLTLPEPLQAWVDARVRAGDYPTGADYLRDLVARDRERVEALAELDRLVEEGFASGTSDRSMDEVLQEARARAGATRRTRAL